MNDDEKLEPGGEPDPHPLLVEIRKLLEELEDSDAQLFRGLCSLARKWRIEPEHFRLLLLQAKLEKERASEIKQVLEAEDTCNRFLQHDLTWKAALSKARLAKPDRLDRAIARLLRMVLEHGHLWPHGLHEGGWTLRRGARGQLRFVDGRGTLDIILLLLPGDPQ